MKDQCLIREVEEVASLLGQSPEFIRNQCRQNKIKATKIGKRWIIPQSEVDRLLMIEPKDISSKTEIIITKLEAENKALSMQLEAIRTFLYGANQVLEYR